MKKFYFLLLLSLLRLPVLHAQQTDSLSLRLDFARLRPDALRLNLLRAQNNQLYDVAGRRQSPYQTRALFAAAPSREYASSRWVTGFIHTLLRLNIQTA